MPFVFLKYLQPTHYFRLNKDNGTYVFPIVDSIPLEVVKLLKPDVYFQSETAKNYDLSWQAIMQGYIGEANTYDRFEEVGIKDNYHFVRKYFHSSWVFYVLIIRLLSFYNPIKEIKGWYKTRKVKRLDMGNNHIAYPKYLLFESNLIKAEPLISVIIPTLNRYEYLKDILKDLEEQSYKNFEVIVVDQSDEVDDLFYKEYTLDIKLIKQEEKALWLARNNAIKAARGSYIALSEDDVRVSSDWLYEHIKCIDYFKAQVSAGVFYPEGKSIPKSRSYFAISSQLATGNALIDRDVFKKVGLFDRQFEKQRMGDGEFGLRIFLDNILSVSNPKAKCIDVKANTGGLRELGSWDAFRPTNIFAPRPIPSVVYFYRRYFGNKATRRALLRTVPISLFSYKLKRNKFFLLLASLFSFILFPFLFLQVYRAWRLATKKIEEGPLIESLIE